MDDEDDWLDRAARSAQERLIATDPALLSPVGRELREYAESRQADAVRRETLHLVR